MVFSRRIRQPQCDYARRSVIDDWIRALPHEKNQIFGSIVGSWESSLAMVSVALNDALATRGRGKLVCAQQHVSIAAALLKRLSASLVGSCDSLASRGRRIPEVPLVEPLQSGFFRGSAAQAAATWNAILHRVIFGDRQRLMHKLRILSNMIEQLEREFDEAARSIARSGTEAKSWMALDHLHYDFTTCLREAEVVFKSFLRALPAEELAAFAGEIENPPARARLRLRLGFSRASA